ncbi:MAG: hypothetical protein IIZ25_04705, partial [Thermoguttaceae bacterium]|nr:hypothetical protein [Thermoguttaceae bacterium]
PAKKKRKDRGVRETAQERRERVKNGEKTHISGVFYSQTRGHQGGLRGKITKFREISRKTELFHLKNFPAGV